MLVSHPNVRRVHDLNTIDGQSFVSMEYIDGEDLAALLRRVGRLAGDRALEIARELCAGLDARKPVRNAFGGLPIAHNREIEADWPFLDRWF